MAKKGKAESPKIHMGTELASSTITLGIDDIIFQDFIYFGLIENPRVMDTALPFNYNVHETVLVVA